VSRVPALSPLLLAVLASAGACTDQGTQVSFQQPHSSPIAASPDGSRLYVVHPDADSVSILDTGARTIVGEVPLGNGPPSVNAAGRFDPNVGPRALALDSVGRVLYVTGQRSSRLYAVNPDLGTVTASVLVCSEPVGVVVSKDDASVFVACAQDDEIVEVSTASMAIVATVAVPRKPWGLAWGADGRTLVATHLLGPGVSMIATSPLALSSTWLMADGPAMDSVTDPASGEDPTEPHGTVRGIYDAVVRPGTEELWVAHLMLGIDTPEPELDFQNTVFPAISLFDGEGHPLKRLSVEANPGDNGAFGDVVSGPRSMTFTSDGRFAFVVDADSEDVLVIDATQRIETTLVRPLPGHLPEGAVLVNGELYVQERNTEDVAAFKVQETATGVTVIADGPSFKSLTTDPMPAELRLGQKLFYSANSDDVPMTQNHWAACASCHVEGRSDAVTWRFAEGPRDTPTNAGGTLDTGFLLRTADRTKVEDYWQTINLEMGGHFSPTAPSQVPLLAALADYVNHAIPVPVPPHTDPTLTARGEQVFAAVGCGSCHSGPAKTDSGSGNPALNLAGPMVSTMTTGGVLLHDVGTCVTDGPWTDVAHDDIDGHPRAACAFDTPALRGLWDSAPYLHDGSLETLDDVIPPMLYAVETMTGKTPTLSTADRQALAEYLRSL